MVETTYLLHSNEPRQTYANKMNIYLSFLIITPVDLIDPPSNRSSLLVEPSPELL